MFAPYAVVPNNNTQMDQLKVGAQLTDDTKAYAFLMLGSNTEEELQMTRLFNNVDVRVTNTSFKNVSLTAYGGVYNEDESAPSAAAVQAINHPNPDPAAGPTLVQISDGLLQPIDYHKVTAGLKGTWRPWGGGYDQGGLAIMAGYEYGVLDRTNAVYTALPGPSPIPPTEPFTVVLDESRTITNSFQIGPDYRWSATFDTFIRYKYQHADEPLIGFTFSNGIFNTLLPQEDHIVEVGFNWVPADWLVMFASIGIEESWNHSLPASVDLTSQTFDQLQRAELPDFARLVVRSQRKALLFSRLQRLFELRGAERCDRQRSRPVQRRRGHRRPGHGAWNYNGQAHVVTLGSRYRASHSVTFSGEFEWVRGLDAITNSTTFFPNSGNTITDLGSYSTVSNVTTRVRLGVDWKLAPRVGTFFRYELYNFDDIAPGYQTGLAQGVLGGFLATY